MRWHLLHNLPFPVLGSRTALLGLGANPLLLIIRVLGVVSTGVPKFRGRALRAFWDMLSGWVFTPLQRTAIVTDRERDKTQITHRKNTMKEPKLHLKLTSSKTGLDCGSGTYTVPSSLSDERRGEAHQAIVDAKKKNKKFYQKTLEGLQVMF